MWNPLKYKTLKWELVEYIDSPKISHLTTREMTSKTEVFAQITVRFHTKQVKFNSAFPKNIIPTFR